MLIAKTLLLLTLTFAGSSIIDEQSQIIVEPGSGRFMLGNESLLEMHDSPLAGKRIAMITNNSGVLSDGRMFMDVLNDRYRISKVFTPEHGLKGNERNEDYYDAETGAFVISLYGKKEKPTADDLSDIDVIVYDIQDVSARFYTFINTLYYCIEAAAENRKKLFVCDRPIIPDGNYVDGFVLSDPYKSFVGLLNVPAAYAMTCGEIAQFINGEYFSGRCDLEIIKMKNYDRNISYDELNLYWKNPSPNMYFPSTAVAYLGTCLFEGTNISEGRGSPRPFEYIGAPFCDGEVMASSLNQMQLPGVEFEPVDFVPKKLASWMTKPKYMDETCSGIYINITDRKTAQPFRIAVALLVTLRDRFPQFSINSNNFIDKLAGTDRLRHMLTAGSDYEEIINSYEDELRTFNSLRSKYLLY